MWKLNREPVEAEDPRPHLGAANGLFEGYIEWANSSPLQKMQRQLLGVHHDEPMSERLLPKPLSPNAYRKESDGPSYSLASSPTCSTTPLRSYSSHSSMGARKAISALATTATQAIAAFGEIVHPVIELGSSSYENSYRTILDPKLNVIGYVTDKRARETDTYRR